MTKLLILLIFLFSVMPAGSAKALYFCSVAQPAYTIDPATGASSLGEISNAIFTSLQTNKSDQLTSYFLTDKEINYLRQLGSEDMNAVLENKSATDLKNSFETDLQTVVQEGVAKTLNWSELNLAETKTGKGSEESRLLFPVETVLQSKLNQPVSLLYEVVKINNRYYLFRGIKLKP